METCICLVSGAMIMPWIYTRIKATSTNNLWFIYFVIIKYISKSGSPLFVQMFINNFILDLRLVYQKKKLCRLIKINFIGDPRHGETVFCGLVCYK